MKIGVFVGSIRRSGLGMEVGQWVMDVLADDPGIEPGIISLRNYQVPLLDVDYMPAEQKGRYPDGEVQRFAEAIAGFDAYIFVTPEYNKGVPGPMKNAVDHLMVEWVGKPVGFVGYGGQGARVAVSAWRPTVRNFKMRDVEPAVELNIFGEDFAGDKLTPRTEKAEDLKGMVAKIVECSKQ